MIIAAIVNVHLFSVNIYFKSNIFFKVDGKGTLLLLKQLTFKNEIPPLAQLMPFTAFPWQSRRTSLPYGTVGHNPYPSNSLPLSFLRISLGHFNSSSPFNMFKILGNLSIKIHHEKDSLFFQAFSVPSTFPSFLPLNQSSPR